MQLLTFVFLTVPYSVTTINIWVT